MSTGTEVHLMWYGSYQVSDLQKILLKDVSESDKLFPALNTYGFYLYLDNSESHSKYIGQAFDDSPRSLRNRIRWEIVKNGRAGAISTFFSKCIDNNIDVASLKIKVGHIQKISSLKGNNDVNVRIMNNIENALIYEVKPFLNKTGKKQYRDDPIIIYNSGNYSPLKKIIKGLQFIKINN